VVKAFGYGNFYCNIIRFLVHTSKKKWLLGIIKQAGLENFVATSKLTFLS